MLTSLWSVLVTLYTLSRLHPVATDWRVEESDYIKKINYNIAIEEMKLRVLQGMNRSEPPHVDFARTYKPEPKINISRLFRVSPQAPDFHRDDVISFKFDSCAHSVHIEKALLIFYVHSMCGDQKRVTNNDQSGTHRTKVKNCRRKQQNQLRNRSKFALMKLGRPGHRVQTVVSANSNPPSNGFIPRNSNILYDITSNNTSDDIATRKSLIDFPTDHLLLDESQVQRLKIVVRVVNTTTYRKRNIAMQEIKIKRTSAVVVSVPTKYLQQALLTDDHTLTLQIVCRRCGRCAWVESVHTLRQNSGNKGNVTKHKRRMVNPNRPYMYIDMKNSTCTNWINFNQSLYSDFQKMVTSRVTYTWS